MAINLSQASKLIRIVNQLHQLTQIENGDLRWKALQKARKDYPEVDNLIADYIDDPPSEVFGYLLEDFDFDKNLIPLLDPKGLLRAKVEGIITVIQTLYKEREAKTQ